MRPRELAGALALGLPAALLGHTVAYGGSHSVGGSFHGVLVGLTVAAAAAMLFGAACLAWTGAGRILQGSVLAARIEEYLPGWTASTIAAGLWFTLAEHVEPRHDALSPLILIAALALSAWILLLLAHFVLSLLAAIAIAVRAAVHVTFTPSPRLHLSAAPRAHYLLRAVRHYARPPPFAVAGA